MSKALNTSVKMSGRSFNFLATAPYATDGWMRAVSYFPVIAVYSYKQFGEPSQVEPESSPCLSESTPRHLREVFGLNESRNSPTNPGSSSSTGFNEKRSFPR